MAEVYLDVDVLEAPEVEIGPDDEDNIDLESGLWEIDISNHYTMAGSEELQQTSMGGGPNQDIYEVEEILAGPRKRREHNFLQCYKIRWKNFGEEADSWQPLSDLENVMEMIHEYNRRKRAESQKKKKLQKHIEDSQITRTLNVSEVTRSTSLDTDDCDSEESNVFGNLKDRFWKKLEMGLLDEEVFEGDMYSKVKGSRRAAHADAASNIQRMQQQIHSHRTVADHSAKVVTKIRSKPKQGKKSSKSKNVTMISPMVCSESKPDYIRSVRKTRKRSCDPFSARGYTSAKRRRRSRDQKHSNSNLTSLTLGFMALPQDECIAQESNGNVESYEVKTNGQTVEESLENHRHIVGKPVFHTLDSGFGDENEDMDTKMTVTSETMLTVTTQSRRLDTENVIQPEEIIKLQSDDNFLPDPKISVVEDPTSAAAESHDQLYPASGAIESPNNFALRSTLDTMSEACGAVERSHSEECLWGGACNRSDCKSNRRWNMKNGKSQSEDKVSSTSSSSTVVTSTTANSSTNNTSSNSLIASHPISSSGSYLPPISQTESVSSPQTNRSSSSSSQNPSTKRKLPSNHPVSHRQKGITSPFSSHESKSDKNPSWNAERDSVFDALTQRIFGEEEGNASSSKEVFSNSKTSRDMSSRNSTQTSTGNISSVNSSIVCERPGIFSDNSSFSFISDNPHLNLVSTSVREPSEVPSSVSPSGSINSLSSPGKENFSNVGHGKSDRNNLGSSGHERYSMLMNLEAESRQEPVSSSSVQAADGLDYMNASDDWSQRKRGSENNQPLEKIPSPNSRKVSDLDRRVSSLTCDDLEDMDVQGDDHKNEVLVTNADLLQAVNLSKAEVVRRAIKQSADNCPKLDFEQPDGSGFSLLMRAVQKGSIAIVEMLIENGANVNAQQINGTTPLMLAVEQKEICIVALLLKYGANSSMSTVSSDQGETALIKAIKKQNKEAVSLMLRTGVNFSSSSCSSISALEAAVERRNPQIEALIRSHIERLEHAFEERVLETLQDTAQILDKLFPIQCFPLRESPTFTVTFNSILQPVTIGEGFLLFIAHTKINDKGVRCRFHGTCPIASVTLNGVAQSPLTKEVNFVTSCHPVVPGCNTLVITKHPDYLSKAKLIVCAYRAKLLSHV